ncbi:hypothetical protein TSOC_004352 [Tetrabaena socialis]|uniref:DNA replication complex GINS protein SLD5 C-terminal domain-containing protein n=1 Tax=Tetrabaena socialis TaxID=47790 RepID=A0A2J8A923_9CHLO|nr:hypothetical protein TSOC_004352 [Tetrabaena socialis]|eukprot:PNH09028.1 hypothetical protein TSOC_004352 [Tetrabaena socialis]
MADVLGSLFTQELPDDLSEQDDFQLLTNAVRNERNTQDILEFKTDLVERVQQRLDDQVQESQLTDTRDMIPAPRLDRCVLVKLLKDAGHVAVDTEGVQMVDMKAGDIYIIQYKLVQRLVQQDMAVLI